MDQTNTRKKKQMPLKCGGGDEYCTYHYMNAPFLNELKIKTRLFMMLEIFWDKNCVENLKRLIVTENIPG